MGIEDSTNVSNRVIAKDEGCISYAGLPEDLGETSIFVKESM